MAHPANTLTLVADIGGTNTRVALAKGKVVLTDTIRRYANKDFPGLETVLRQYISDEGDVDTKAACIAVAGPVRDGRASMTNLDWTIDEETVARATSAENVAILNDLQAQGHAVGHLEHDKVRNIIDGPQATDKSTKIVIGVGTGFNAAPIFDTVNQRLVTPSCQFVSTAHGFPAVEDVLSGRGLERVYSFLAQKGGSPSEKSAADIMKACADGSDALAPNAARIFARILGTVCGNLSLIHLPFGGVYLVGGVSRAFAPYLIQYGFGDAFRDKGRFAGFMANFAVNVIEDDYAALTGSAAFIANS